LSCTLGQSVYACWYMRPILVALLLVALGCATTKKYERVLQSWVGSTENQLIASWGVPTRTYENGGMKFLEYTRSSGMMMQANYNPYVGYQGQAHSKYCTTTFTVNNDRIISWSWQGNTCKSK